MAKAEKKGARRLKSMRSIRWLTGHRQETLEKDFGGADPRAAVIESSIRPTMDDDRTD
ncbi:hypothetical protein [Mesorhizobium sp. M0244]|uniref:hypothetical protein n=1 Tax=Mesorhizobium sp. M0244 TaxID=2956926 RepID=UPI0033396612